IHPSCPKNYPEDNKTFLRHQLDTESELLVSSQRCQKDLGTDHLLAEYLAVDLQCRFINIMEFDKSRGIEGHFPY
ncbi:MAG: hypothetical protein NUV76_07190, partial [Candidatus Kuenenia sp.]|nr:hypothetical protein [Candidatus Kuenenia sp.]